MTYFKINGVDFSMYVSKLKVANNVRYKARENASGNLLVKYITTKRIIEVGIIPLDENALSNLQKEIKKFTVTVSFLNPETNALETINCVIPESSIEYYTIRAGNVMTKAFALVFTEQ